MTTLTIRPYAGEQDLQAIVDLLNTCDAVYHLDDNYAVDDLRLEFADPRMDPTEDLRLWEDGDGRLVGFGQLWSNKDSQPVDGYLYFRIHPDARNEEIEDEIIAWGSGRLRTVARELGADAVLRSGFLEHETMTRALLERYGFAPVRYFFRMARPLDLPIPEPEFPVGITLRHVCSDADAERWVDAFNRSFIDHWNFHPATIESHQHWLRHPSYRAERDLVAVAPDGTFAGFCFCIIDPADNERNGRNDGWIGELGTCRGYRRIGLGRALLLAGLHRLKADGAATAKLGVDAENPSGALGLYESVGFTRTQTRVLFSKDLALYSNEQKG